MGQFLIEISEKPEKNKNLFKINYETLIEKIKKQGIDVSVEQDLRSRKWIISFYDNSEIIDDLNKKKAEVYYLNS